MFVVLLLLLLLNDRGQPDAAWHMSACHMLHCRAAWCAAGYMLHAGVLQDTCYMLVCCRIHATCIAYLHGT